MKKRALSTSRTTSRRASSKAKAGETRAVASRKAKTGPKRPGTAAAGRTRASEQDAPRVPAFLTPRQFKKLAEMTRRQRISQARTKTVAARPTAAKRKVWDYSVGFDPQDDD